jgi:serine/threonine protein kinase
MHEPFGMYGHDCVKVDFKYKLIKPIGHGAYGVVCSAEDVVTRKKVAIKKITKGWKPFLLSQVIFIN